MTKIDWIIFGIAWGSVPAVLLLKLFLDIRRAKIWRETEPEIQKGIKDLINRM